MANVNSVSDPFHFPHRANTTHSKNVHPKNVGSRVNRSLEMDARVQRHAAS